MRTDGLSFDQIPPVKLPTTFFRRAPLFGVLAGLLLLLQPHLLDNRWEGATLALTHLLALGFAGQIMIGALYQVMPVISSRPISGAERFAPWISGLLMLGCILLAGAFLTQYKTLFLLATLSLIAALLIFLLSMLMTLLRIRQQGNSVQVIRLAVASLAIALLLGLNQALFHAFPSSWNYTPWLTDLHLTWATLGWVVLLVMGVSLQVIPMFHVTPAFPDWIHRRVAPAFLVALLVSSVPDLRPAGVLSVALMTLIYVSVAFRLLQQRKRKILDHTVQFWRLALVQLGLFALILPLTLTGWNNQIALPLGALFGGFLLSVIFGMLQKIVPFLLFLHLQRACLLNPMAMLSLPNMKEILPSKESKRLWQLTLALLTTLWLALLGDMTQFGQLAGLLLTSGFASLFWSIQQAIKRFERALQAI